MYPILNKVTKLFHFYFEIAIQVILLKKTAQKCQNSVGISSAFCLLWYLLLRKCLEKLLQLNRITFVLTGMAAYYSSGGQVQEERDFRTSLLLPL